MNILSEKDMDREPVGIFGRMWMQNMEKHYPEKVEVMKDNYTYLSVARSVDKRAEEYWEQLSDQYDRHNPRPNTTDYEELLYWTSMKNFEIDYLTY